LRNAEPKSLKPLKFRVGHYTNKKSMTGCTVLLFDKPSVCSVHVAGGAPGSRETELLDPSCSVQHIHALLLTGGSAFGLSAADGILKYLADRGIGYALGNDRIPIVPGAVIYDRAVGRPSAPGPKDGLSACNKASYDIGKQGKVGAGCGATVGKFSRKLARDRGGLSVLCERFGNGVHIGAVMVVNAVGNVVNPATGEVIAGATDKNGVKHPFMGDMVESIPGGNTTIGAIVTDAKLTKADAKRVAMMAHDGMARAINPSHTLHDGDAVFVVSTGAKEADVNSIGIWAAEITARAVVKAVVS